MALSKRVFGQIIQASAHSEAPMDEEVLRELAEERGDDPDLLVQRHSEMRRDYFKKKSDDSEPLPTIVS